VVAGPRPWDVLGIERLQEIPDRQHSPDAARVAEPLPADSWQAVLALQRTAGNQAVTRWLARQDAAAAPAPAPNAAPLLQPPAQVIAALETTVERVRAAIAERDSMGRVPQAMNATLCRFFPGFGDDFLDDILARLQPMSSWVPGIKVVPVTPPATNPPHPDAVLIEQVRLALVATDPDVPAFTMIRRVVNAAIPNPAMAGDDYIVVLQPQWDADADLQATRLLHEYFHFAFVGMGHGAGDPLNSAHAWQGFVSVVGGLETGEQMGQFPVCSSP